MEVRIRRKDRPAYRVLTIGSLIVLVVTLSTLPWNPEWLGVAVGVAALLALVLGVYGWWGIRWREERYVSGGRDPSGVE